MDTQELSVLLLGIVGAAIQLAFKFLPKLSDWYEAQENKGLIMLATVTVISLIYFGLGCTSLAGMLKIMTTCDVEGFYKLFQAWYILASAQSLTYLYTRNNAVLSKSPKG